MSIFPKKCVPGSQIAFHVRYPGPRDVGIRRDEVPIFGEIALTIHEPDGTRVALYHFLPTLVPQPPSPNLPSDSSTQIRKKMPLMFVAEQLQGNRRSSSDLVDLLGSISQSTHYYTHYTVAQDAQPGVYRTLVETWIRGVKREKWNEFRVEWLEVKSVVPDEAGFGVTVHNPSREPVVARILPLDQDQSRAQVVTLAPGIDTIFKTVDMPAVLLYADDAQSIPLSEEGDALVYVNPRRPSMASDCGEKVEVLGATTEDPGHELTGAAQEIWNSVMRPGSRKKIRSIAPDIYDAMLGAGLIFEIETNTNLRSVPDFRQQT